MPNRKYLVRFGIGVSMLLFFGFMAYRTLVYKETASATRTIQTLSAQFAHPVTPTERAEATGVRRASIALQEYSKNVWETPRGCDCGPEIDKYTEGLHQQWCTMFASWVAKESGNPFADEKTGSWKLTNSRQLAEYLQSHGVWHSADEARAKNLQPRVGDYIIFWRGDFEDNLGHATIVIRAADGGKADIVGGNHKDHVAFDKDFDWLHNYGLLGFGRPEKD